MIFLVGIACLVIGSIMGVLVACLCVIASEEDK